MSTVHTCKHGEVDCGRHWDCDRCTREERAIIWARMTEAERNYDRRVDPLGAYTSGLSAPGGDTYYSGPPEGCSCHISPPCSFCVEGPEPEEQEPPQ